MARESRTLCLKCLHELDREQTGQEDADCEVCENPLNAGFQLIPDSYYESAIRAAVFKECLKASVASYVAHSAIACTVHHVPKPFINGFMDQVLRASSSPDSLAWDKEGPRTMWKNFSDSRAWTLTTMGAVHELCSFQYLAAGVVPEGEKAFGQFRQLKSGDLLVALPPCEVSWSSTGEDEDDGFWTVRIQLSTGIIAPQANAHLHVSAMHPDDTSEEGALLHRWRHLPFYNDWTLYTRWKCREFLRDMKRKLLKHTRKILVSAMAAESWGASEPPQVVESRIPPPGFRVTNACYLPYQHPRLSRTMCGSNTLKEHRETLARLAAKEEKAAQEEAAYQAAYEEWQRAAYTYGKEVTERCNSTVERRAANLERGYSMAADPRFNGQHADANYDGVGDDP